MEEISQEPEAGQSYSAALGEHAGNPEQPRQVGVPLVVGDRTLTLATDEMRIKAQFEQRLKEKALETIRDAMRRNDPEEADLMRSVYMGDVATGAYTWDGRYGRAARKDWDGMTHLLYLMLRRCHPKITLQEVADLMEDDPRACGDAMRASQGNWPSSLAKAKRERKRAALANGTHATESPTTMDQ